MPGVRESVTVFEDDLLPRVVCAQAPCPVVAVRTEGRCRGCRFGGHSRGRLGAGSSARRHRPHSPAAPAEARPSPLDTRRPAGSPNTAVVDFQRPLARIAFGARADPASWVAAADGEDARVPEPEDSVRGAAAAGAIGPREVASAEQAEATGAGDPRSLIQQRSSRSSTPRRKPPSRNFRAYLQSRCGSVCSRRSAGRCAQGHGARRSRRNT